MLADPQSITIGSSPGTVSLPRVSAGDGKSTYQSADGTITMKISHQYGRRQRIVARVDFKKVSADLFLPDTNVALSTSCYIVWDAPANGFTATELKDLAKGLIDLLSASTYASTAKVLGGES